MGLPYPHVRPQIYDEVSNPAFVSMNRVLQLISPKDQARGAFLWNALLIAFSQSYLLASIRSLVTQD